MAQAKAKGLTYHQIRNEKAPVGRCKNIADGNGLYFRVFATGVKSWMVKYKCPSSGQQSSITVGNYPEITLNMARGARSRIHMMVDLGVDPKDHKNLMFDGDIKSLGDFRWRCIQRDLLTTRRYM